DFVLQGIAEPLGHRRHITIFLSEPLGVDTLMLRGNVHSSIPPGENCWLSEPRFGLLPSNYHGAVSSQLQCVVMLTGISHPYEPIFSISAKYIWETHPVKRITN
ncbi:hypothetical protein H8E77_28080, partial [bacterium]|nr:hypothetical protein [bacterium]